MKFYLVAKHLSITIQVFPLLGDAAGSWKLPAPVPTSDDSKVVVSHDVVEQRGGILDPSSYVIQPQTNPPVSAVAGSNFVVPRSERGYSPGNDTVSRRLLSPWKQIP